jgi:hypothetical protein
MACHIVLVLVLVLVLVRGVVWVLLEAGPCCRVVVCSDEDGVSKHRGTTTVNDQTAGRRERRKVGNWWCYSIRRCEGGVWGGLWLEHCLCLCPFVPALCKSWRELELGAGSWSRRALSRVAFAGKRGRWSFFLSAHFRLASLSRPLQLRLFSCDPSDEGSSKAKQPVPIEPTKSSPCGRSMSTDEARRGGALEMVLCR